MARSASRLFLPICASVCRIAGRRFSCIDSPHSFRKTNVNSSTFFRAPRSRINPRRGANRRARFKTTRHRVAKTTRRRARFKTTRIADHCVADYRIADYRVADYRIANYRIADYCIADYRVADYRVAWRAFFSESECARFQFGNRTANCAR